MVAILTLAEDLPKEVPTYPIYREALQPGEIVTIVGYGASGNGIQGYSIEYSPTIKRTGQNAADIFLLDDEGSGKQEVFLFDFDGTDPSTNLFGGSTLGNDVETMVGGGDSGGPNFIKKGHSFLIAGVTSFPAPNSPLNGKFGTAAGSILVSSYADWIDNVISNSISQPVSEPKTIIGLALMGTGIILFPKQKKN